MPFRDDASTSSSPVTCLSTALTSPRPLRELQRVARAGYIECPDAFLERINPYKDHRYEVTERDGTLVTRRKYSWIRDAELVELYEQKVKKSGKWLGHLRQNPFAFHVRYFWSRDKGGIRHVDLTPVDRRSAPFKASRRTNQQSAFARLSDHELRRPFEASSRRPRETKPST